MQVENIPVTLEGHSRIGTAELGPDNHILIVLDENMSDEVRTFLLHDMMTGLSISVDFKPEIVKYCNG